MYAEKTRTAREGTKATRTAGARRRRTAAAAEERAPMAATRGNHSVSPAQPEELANVLPRQVSGLARMLYSASGSAIPRGMRSVLFALSTGPLQVSQIARQEGIGQSAATRMVARLEALGLVQRERSATDGRVVIVSVTDRGRCALEDMREQSRRVMRAVLRDRTPTEVRQLTQASDALELLIGLIHDITIDGSAPPAKPRGAADREATAGQSTRAASARRNTRRALPS